MSLGLPALSIAAKLGLYWGSLTATGIILMRLWVPSLAVLDHDLRRLTLWAAIVGLTGTLLGLASLGAVMTGQVFGLFDPMIVGLILDTPVGAAATLRFAGFGLIMLGLVLPRFRWAVSAAGAAAVLLAFVLSGHIPALQHGWLSLALFVHLLGLAAWIGVIPALRLLASTPATRAAAAELGHRFGQMAALFIPVLILAGGVMAWHLLGVISKVFTTAYGAMFLAKLAAVTLLLLLGLRNRQTHVPDLRRGAPDAGHALLRMLRLERAVIMLILLATAVLTSSTSPPA